MAVIETQEDWWAEVDKNLGALRSLVANYCPGTDAYFARPGMEITARTAEEARQSLLPDLATEHPDPVEEFDQALSTRDGNFLARLFSATWFGVPESMGAWDIPGFGVLCDLCSEAWVFLGEFDE